MTYKYTYDWYSQVKDYGIEKLESVEGQVILVDADIADRLTMPLVDYIQQFWLIPSNCKLKQISGCMLRGTTHVESDQIQNSSLDRVALTEENFPPHRHQSSVTDGSGIVSMKGDDSVTSSSGNGSTYDMFYNDSFSVGLDQNEVEGTVDQFKVQNAGKEVVTHNNLPLYQNYYAFVVTKVV